MATGILASLTPAPGGLAFQMLKPNNFPPKGR
jgi:hypothetical protein